MAQAEGDFGYFVGGDGGGDAFVVIDWEDWDLLEGSNSLESEVEHTATSLS